jgi:arginyl-tRNA synthetase
MSHQADAGLTLPERLATATAAAFGSRGLDPRLGQIAVSTKLQDVDFQCNGVMAAARQLRRGPREVAQDIVADLGKTVDFATMEVAGPGFINFRIGSAALDARLDALKDDPRSGHRRSARSQRIIVDYGGPNAAKAMHVGHLRSAVIGQCLKNLLRFQGHDAVGDIHLGDWGLQMGQLITEIARTQPDLVYFAPDATGPFPPAPPFTMEDLLTLYPQASARSKDDPAAREAARIATAELQAGRPGYRALWQHIVDVSIAEIRRDYARMGIEFEQWFGESRYQDRLAALIARLVAAGVAEESDGALVVRVAKDQSDSIPPLILRNSDEGFGYGATDLATIDERVNDFGAAACLYVVDARQRLHFEQVFRAARRSVVGAKPVELGHLPFGTVNGADGKPFKTREGGVMRLADLMRMLVSEAKTRIQEAGMGADFGVAEIEAVAEMVGLAALKFADLQHDRESDYVFDVVRFSKFEGRTGPYLQYAGVRIKSLLAKAAEAGLAPGPIRIVQPIERELALMLDRFHLTVERTAELRNPHVLAEHLYALASLYSHFYHGSRILAEDDKARAGSWLGLSKLVLIQLQLGLSLLGIDIPARM